ncbi:MAG: hypothetical protein Q8Q85_11105 [Gemmatimonadales bacterium]|nr:hypothetical protein [Gemmatimonadales bacterium]
MPVTAKLSLLFYEKLGEQVATELVEWFNSVDATYRSDLRELNELNFARFDAKLEQRLAELGAGLRTEFGRRLDALDAKLEQRFAELDGRFAGRFAQQDARFTILEARLLGRMEAMQGGIKADLVRWMFGFWTGTMIALAGVLLAVLRAQ